MKMTAIFVFLMLFLSGCSSHAWERVEDTALSVTVSVKPEQLYKVSVELPDMVALIDERNNCAVYATDTDDFEVETRVFPASSYQSAVKTISGVQADDLAIFQLESNGINEYRFSWVTNSENSTKICSAKLMMVGEDCYAVVCKVDESTGTAFQEEIRQVFATFHPESNDLV